MPYNGVVIVLIFVNLNTTDKVNKWTWPFIPRGVKLRCTPICLIIQPKHLGTQLATSDLTLKVIIYLINQYLKCENEAIFSLSTAFNQNFYPYYFPLNQQQKNLLIQQIFWLDT